MEEHLVQNIYEEELVEDTDGEGGSPDGGGGPQEGAVRHDRHSWGGVRKGLTS